MFNLDPGKLLVIAVVAIILLGPDRLPQVARQVGGAWRSFNDFRHRMESEVRSSMPDLPPTSEIAWAGPVALGAPQPPVHHVVGRRGRRRTRRLVPTARRGQWDGPRGRSGGQWFACGGSGGRTWRRTERRRPLRRRTPTARRRTPRRRRRAPPEGQTPGPGSHHTRTAPRAGAARAPRLRRQRSSHPATRRSTDRPAGGDPSLHGQTQGQGIARQHDVGRAPGRAAPPVIICVIAFVIAATIAVFAYEPILNFLLRPLCTVDAQTAHHTSQGGPSC